MDDGFGILTKGSKISLETLFEVVDINHHTMTVTLRNVRSGETGRYTDWWFHNMRQQGFKITLVEEEVLP